MSACYVHIVLPGETEFVTAGRFELGTNRHGTPTGRFVYGKSYLARDDAVAIDPLELKLGPRTYETSLLNGMFGALRDASPDYWGRRVMEKRIGKPRLDEVDYLLFSPDDRAGALGFGRNVEPPVPRREFNRTLDLDKLQEFADAIIADDDLPEGNAAAEQVQALMLEGTSMGGARPKAVVEDDDALWIAKFNRPDDRWNHARAEHAMLRLARVCGIDAAESRVTAVGDRDVLLVRRFDREKADNGYRRARMLSALTLLRADDSHTDREKWSYVLLAEEMRRICAQPMVDASELFRRMCFNALITNTDDHPRNHAVIAMDDDWRLSPAYDLTPRPEISLERRDLALGCGDMGRYAHADNLLSQHARFMLDAEQARAMVDETEAIVRARWYETARREGLSEKDCDALKGAFAYPGFRLEIQDPAP